MVVIVVVIVTEGEFSDKGNEQALTRAVEWSGRRASSTTASSVTKMTLLQLGNRGAVADFGGPSLLGGASMARRSRRSPRAAPTDLPVIAAAYEGVQALLLAVTGAGGDVAEAGVVGVLRGRWI